MVPSGIDREMLFLQFERLEEHLSRLREVQTELERQTGRESLLVPAAERLLQVSIEDCLNIGNHLIAGLPLKRADTYREVFIRLKEAGILPAETGRAMEEFASFRSRLVHLYWEVTPDELFTKLGELHYLKRFAEEVVSFLRQRGLMGESRPSAGSGVQEGDS